MDPEELPLVLFAWARGIEPEPVRCGGPYWVRLWCHLQHPQDLTPPPGGQPLARLLQRWNAPHRWHSLESCLEQLPRRFHRCARLCWLLLLLEHHGERSIPGLLRWLSSRDDDLAELAAFGLGRLGRVVLVDLEDRWKAASPAVRQRICEALWYLGPLARGCTGWMGDDRSPWARAVFLRLEQHGWQPLLQQRVAPLWLCADSLEAIASLAFSCEVDDRLYAVEALASWGEPCPQVEPLLRVLYQDPEPQVALRSQERLVDLGLPLPRTLLMSSLLGPDDDMRELATRSLLGCAPAEAASPIRQQLALLEFLQGSEGLELEAGLMHLAHRSWPDSELALRLRHWFHHPDSRVRQRAWGAFLALGGGWTELELCCQTEEGRVELCSFLRDLERWDVLLCLMSAPGVLDWMKKSYLLWFLLARIGPCDVRRVRLRLEQLLPASEELLGQLSLDSIPWDQWPQLNETQRVVARQLLCFHRCVPQKLLDHLEQFGLADKELLSLLAEFVPNWPELFKRLWGRVEPSLRQPLAQQMLAAGLPGWLILLGLEPLGDSRAWLSGVLAQALENSEILKHCLDAGPILLEKVSDSTMRRCLARALGSRMLSPMDPPDGRRRRWALALWEVAEVSRGCLFYLWRLYRPQAELALDAALQHPNPEVRGAALEVLALCDPEFVRRLRSRAPDPRAELRFRQLKYLQRRGPLNAEEWQELRRLAIDPEVGPEVAQWLEELS